MIGIINRLCFLIIMGTLMLLSCKSESQSIPYKQTEEAKENFEVFEKQIADYIRHIYKDSNHNFWFGTNRLGVAHYDGTQLSYYSIEKGFHGQQITGIAEDKSGALWFATDLGLVKRNQGASAEVVFQNFESEKYFEGQRFWSIFIDDRDVVWAGATRGIYRYENNRWTKFDLPYPIEIAGDFITEATAWSITQDSAGDMWFSTNGFGAFKYDGDRFIQYTQEDGLVDNSVDVIVEGHNKAMWFGTRFGGVSRLYKGEFTSFSQRSGHIDNDEVCSIYSDSKGNIWMSSEGYGVYKYDGQVFTNYGIEEGLEVSAVQDIYEDEKGIIWVGGGGGLFKLDGDYFINVKASGPWD